MRRIPPWPCVPALHARAGARHPARRRGRPPCLGTRQHLARPSSAGEAGHLPTYLRHESFSSISRVFLQPALSRAARSHALRLSPRPPSNALCRRSLFPGIRIRPQRLPRQRSSEGKSTLPDGPWLPSAHASRPDEASQFSRTDAQLCHPGYGRSAARRENSRQAQRARAGYRSPVQRSLTGQSRGSRVTMGSMSASDAAPLPRLGEVYLRRQRRVTHHAAELVRGHRGGRVQHLAGRHLHRYVPAAHRGSAPDGRCAAARSPRRRPQSRCPAGRPAGGHGAARRARPARQTRVRPRSELGRLQP